MKVMVKQIHRPKEAACRASPAAKEATTTTPEFRQLVPQEAPVATKFWRARSQGAPSLDTMRSQG
eukprot:11725458-Prorocentrum_lima.AAC.1